MLDAIPKLRMKDICSSKEKCILPSCPHEKRSFYVVKQHTFAKWSWPSWNVKGEKKTKKLPKHKTFYFMLGILQPVAKMHTIIKSCLYSLHNALHFFWTNDKLNVQSSHADLGYHKQVGWVYYILRVSCVTSQTCVCQLHLLKF